MDLSQGDPRPDAVATLSVRVEGVEFRVRADVARQPFWCGVSAGFWEPHTFRALRRFLDPGCSLVDIGAWIGPMTLYAGRLARRVHAIEPDPIAHIELAANLAVNPELADRVALHRLCIAPEPGPAKLYAGGMYYGGSSRFGDSMSGILPTAGDREQPCCQVDGERIEEFLEGNAIDDCRLIKMDVEGAEYCLIPGRWRRLSAHAMPTLCVSFHAPAPAQRETLIGDCLEELRACYKWIYAASDRAELNVGQLLHSVTGWDDESPGSPWLALERLLGDGVVASNEAW